ncbi:MAG: TetR/AcrR family transcriptional regulator [Polyangiales bacterium]
MDDVGSVGRRAQEREREDKILRAALEELAQSDYGGMTIEGVAARAGVNKTTVYRKWETKAALIRAALYLVVDRFKVPPTSGDLRADLLGMAQRARDFLLSHEGQCLMRVRILETPEPELAAIAAELNENNSREFATVFAAATARGELPARVDARLLTDLMWGVIHARLMMRREPVDDALLARVVDTLVAGARALTGNTPKAKSTSPRRKKAGRKVSTVRRSGARQSSLSGRSRPTTR